MATTSATNLELRSVGKLAGTFIVPPYQRGYRWGDEEVGLLLSDIWENGDQEYCLQPIVVKQLADGRFELIDGQQRLTTLYLVFRYLKQSVFPSLEMKFSIEYQSRPRSAEYLSSLEEARKDENIDFFHIYNAHQRIQAWFQKHDQVVALDVARYLGRRVKVIWYEAGPEVDSTTLFTRLNVGRIALTPAELVKALLLRRREETDLERHRQIEVAAQWDMIERDLRDEEFWAFLSNAKGSTYPTRIELILELMAGTVRPRSQLQTFFCLKDMIDKQSVEEVWRQVLEHYELVREWYRDRNLYHKVGFLVATGESIANLVDASRQCTKSDFGAHLDARIRSRLNLTAEDLREVTYEQWDKASELLLLLNVETLRTLQTSSERYPFEAHKRLCWTLEHIHAQNAELLTKKEQWQEWLREHRAALSALQPEEPLRRRRDELVEQIDSAFPDINKESFAGLAPAITAFLSPTDASEAMHSISNLALLSSEDNSALNNSVFEVKRRRTIERDRLGSYIPLCTRRVFFKYYTDAPNQQLHFWSDTDRKCYLDAMLDIVGPYLKPAPGGAA